MDSEQRFIQVMFIMRYTKVGESLLHWNEMESQISQSAFDGKPIRKPPFQHIPTLNGPSSRPPPPIPEEKYVDAERRFIELWGKPEDEIKALCIELDAKQVETAKQEELEYLGLKPISENECERLAKLGSLTINEATALLSGFDPETISNSIINKNLERKSAKDIADNFTLINRNLEAPVFVQVLCNWADELELELPAYFVATVEKFAQKQNATRAKKMNKKSSRIDYSEVVKLAIKGIDEGTYRSANHAATMLEQEWRVKLGVASGDAFITTAGKEIRATLKAG